MIRILVCWFYGPNFKRTFNHQERCTVCNRSRNRHGERYR